MQHARLSPSSAHRWAACPGSVALSDGIPDRSGPAATVGRALHELAHECIQAGGRSAVERVGDTILGVTITKGQAEGVDLYVQNMMARARGARMAMYEVSVPIAAYTGEAGACGTADAVFYRPGGRLEVHDFKCGRVPVSAQNNLQLILYALGARDLLAAQGHVVGAVALGIHQPFVGPTPDIWELSAQDLFEFGARIKAAAGAALAPDAPRVPSSEACRWCPAATICPELVFDHPDPMSILRYHMRRPPSKPTSAEIDALFHSTSVI